MSVQQEELKGAKKKGQGTILIRLQSVCMIQICVSWKLGFLKVDGYCFTRSELRLFVKIRQEQIFQICY